MGIIMYSYSGANLDYKSLSRQFWRILLTCSILLFILAFVSVVVAIVQLAKDEMGEREKDHYYQALPTLLAMFCVSLLGIIAVYIENNGLLLSFCFMLMLASRDILTQVVSLIRLFVEKSHELDKSNPNVAARLYNSCLPHAIFLSCNVILSAIGFGSITIIIKHYYEQSEGRLFEQDVPKERKERPWIATRYGLLNKLRRRGDGGSERFGRESSYSDAVTHSHTDSMGRFDI